MNRRWVALLGLLLLATVNPFGTASYTLIILRTIGLLRVGYQTGRPVIAAILSTGCSFLLVWGSWRWFF